VCHLLEELIAAHPKIKLVVIDSVAFHFRYNFADMALRNRLLNGQAQSLMVLAHAHSLAVVLTNQMTTKVHSGKDESLPSMLVPALGESWGHACTNRLILYWHLSQRHALLYKSASRQECSVPYAITARGVRSIVKDNS